MRLNLLAAIFTCIIILGCGKEEELPPPIPLDILQEVLAEVLILEPAGRELPYALQDSIYNHYYDLILTEKGYSREDFVTTVQWLQKDPKQLETTYTAVLERIQIIETEANK